jgi:hypothetical protein
VTAAALNREPLSRVVAWSWSICAAAGRKEEDPAARFAAVRRLLLMGYRIDDRGPALPPRIMSHNPRDGPELAPPPQCSPRAARLPKTSDERVITPGKNLGWAGGSDLGLRIAFSEGYSHAMTLNNDTRISKGFVSALLDPRLPADAGIVGPTIDHGFPCAEADQKPDAANYTPRPQYRKVAAVEGTALMLSRERWQTIGGMDVRTFGRYGWGIECSSSVLVNPAFRARACGGPPSYRRLPKWVLAVLPPRLPPEKLRLVEGEIEKIAADNKNGDIALLRHLKPWSFRSPRSIARVAPPLTTSRM